MSFSFDLPDLAVETNYIDNINKQIIYQLGIFIKLPKDFSELVDDKTIKLHKFQDLTSESGHSWLNTFLGAEISLVGLTKKNFETDLRFNTSFDAEKISENANELLQTILRLKPSSAKGTYVKSIYMSSAMGLGVQVDTNTID